VTPNKGLKNDIKSSKGLYINLFRKKGQITKKIGLATNTRPDIAFAVNLHARHNASPTKRHWIGIKNVLRYIHGTVDLDLFYGRNQDPLLQQTSVQAVWLASTQAVPGTACGAPPVM
jgi:hypothetical protein